MSVKRHLAVALGVKAADAGHRVLFMPLDKLIATLIKANKGKPAGKTATAAWLCPGTDTGWGWLSADDPQEPSLFFRLLNRRYEKASIVLTSMKRSLTSSGRDVGDNVLATAILDRLLHHSTTLNIKEKATTKEKHKAGVLAKKRHANQ
ncbi:ATP-binding protein [Escherichia coli]